MKTKYYLSVNHIYSIYENQDKLGTIAIDPNYINKNNYDVKKNTIFLYNNDNKQYYEVPGSISGNDGVILTWYDAPQTEYGGARRNKSVLEGIRIIKNETREQEAEKHVIIEENINKNYLNWYYLIW